MKARDLMTSDPTTCRPSDNLKSVISAMRKEDCGMVPITEGNGEQRVTGVATDRDVVPNDARILVRTIPGGRHAVLRHVGTEDSFGAALVYLYGTWLPQSGEEPRDSPLYCQRVRFFPDVPEHEAVTDIFLPLK